MKPSFLLLRFYQWFDYIAMGLYAEGSGFNFRQIAEWGLQSVLALRGKLDSKRNVKVEKADFPESFSAT